MYASKHIREGISVNTNHSEFIFQDSFRTVLNCGPSYRVLGHESHVVAGVDVVASADICSLTTTLPKMRLGLCAHGNMPPQGNERFRRP